MAHKHSLIAFFFGAIHAVSSSVPRSDATSQCRYLPGDTQWPNEAAWSQLNDTVGGRLVAGVPLGQSCFGAEFNDSSCAAIRSEWTDIEP